MPVDNPVPAEPAFAQPAWRLQRTERKASRTPGAFDAAPCCRPSTILQPHRNTANVRQDKHLWRQDAFPAAALPARNVRNVASLAHPLLFPLTVRNKSLGPDRVATPTKHRHDEATADRGKVREPLFNPGGTGSRSFGVPGPPPCAAARESTRPEGLRRSGALAERRGSGRRRLSGNARNKSLLQGEPFCLSSRTALSLRQSNLNAPVAPERW